MKLSTVLGAVAGALGAVGPSPEEERVARTREEARRAHFWDRIMCPDFYRERSKLERDILGSEKLLEPGRVEGRLEAAAKKRARKAAAVLANPRISFVSAERES